MAESFGDALRAYEKSLHGHSGGFARECLDCLAAREDVVEAHERALSDLEGQCAAYSRELQRKEATIFGLRAKLAVPDEPMHDPEADIRRDGESKWKTSVPRGEP